MTRVLSLNSWWSAASDLEVGQKRRVPHDCGEGRTLIVSRSADGYQGYCFRCSDGAFAPPPVESLAEKLARLASQRTGDAGLPFEGLPLPQVRDVSQWPTEAALWVYRAGLGRSEIGRLGVYYHAPSDRVVLPVLEAGVPVFYQARAYQKGRMPKYIGPTPRPSKLLPLWGTATIPTLTEDMLSAMKVGEVAEGWAVLGTRISDHMVAMLLRRGTAVNLALDPDEAGRKAAARYSKQLRAYGLEVRDVLFPRDPKLMTRDELKEKLG